MFRTGPVFPQKSTGRRGAIAVLVALLMVPLLAFVACCVDIGWMTTTKSNLQNAADSTAAAAARQLADNYDAYTLAPQPNLIISAKNEATTYGARFCAFNGAGAVQSLNLLPGDLQFGFTDANNTYQVNSNYPNTVRVKVRRDAKANGRLPLFFSPVMGRKETDLLATSSATIYTGLISAFGPPRRIPGGGEGASGDDYWTDGSGFSCGLLPVAFDVNNWKTFLASRKSPDGTIHTDSAGAPQIHIYPSPQQSPGNFGLLCIGTWTNSNNIYKNWILNGPSMADVESLISSGEFPVSEASPRPWKGTPGLRSSLKAEFAAIIRQPRLLPLFKPVSTSPYQAARGNGSNTTYDIVGFAGVMVTSVSGSGNNMDISVEPCDVLDPAAVFDPDSIYPAGAEPAGRLRTFTFLPTKFSR